VSDTDGSPSSHRRWIRWAVTAALVGLVIVTIYSATSMFWAVQGVRADVDAAAEAVKGGDFSAASSAVTELADSSTELAGVTSSLTWSLASHLPVIGPSISALNVMASAVADVSVAAEPVLATIAEAGSTTERVAALGSSEDALRTLSSTIDSASSSVGALDPAELRFGLGEQVTELQEALPEAASLASAGADAAAVLPGFMGLDGRRTWMVLLQNPAEARGSGGLFAGYALVEVVDGRPTILEAVSRKESLDEFELPYLDVVSPESAALWGQYLGTWASFNLSGDFPEVAALASAGMAAKGTPVDGVVALDAYVVQALLSGTGKVEHRGVTLDGTNAADFFTKDLYAQYPDFDTVEAKDELALGLVYATIDSLLKRPLDYPTLLSAVPPVVERGHLKMWSPQPAEEEWLTSVGLGGDIASLDPSTSLVALNNATGGKLDAYVTPTVTVYRGLCLVDSTGSEPMQRSAITVTLQNDAPSGLPEYVEVRLDAPDSPAGSTRTLVHVYGPAGAAIDEIYRDGDFGTLVTGPEAGRPVWGSETEILQGEDSTLTYLFTEPVTAGDSPGVTVPGTAIPAEVSVIEVGSSSPCPQRVPGELEIDDYLAAVR
jgi:hypothetical protein